MNYVDECIHEFIRLRAHPNCQPAQNPNPGHSAQEHNSSAWTHYTWHSQEGLELQPAQWTQPSQALKLHTIDSHQPSPDDTTER